MKRLKEKQKEVLEKLVKSGITEGFYLAGGTALLTRSSNSLKLCRSFRLLYSRLQVKNTSNAHKDNP